MKKQIITTILALIMLIVTVFSASAQILQPIQTQNVEIGLSYEFDIFDHVAPQYQQGWDLLFLAEIDVENINIEVSNDHKFSIIPTFEYGTSAQITINAFATNQTNATDTVNETHEFSLAINYEAFTMTLNTANAPTSAIVEEEYEFQLQASSNREAGKPKYVYAFEDEKKPEGMTMTNEGLIRWTPSVEQFGTHTVKVSAIPENAPSQLNPIVREFSVTVQALTIDRIEVRSDSRRLETISRSNYLSQTAPYVIDRDASLGEEIELRISIRNNLPVGTDNEIRDVEIEIYSFDLVDADGQDAFISRIRPGRSEEQTISFLLDPQDLHPDDSPFDIEVRIYGETRDGRLFSDIWELELRIESKSYDLLIRNLVMSSELVCAGERIRVDMNLRNIGTRDLSNLGVRYLVAGLGINQFDRNMNLDYDDSRTITTFLTIPQDAIPGQYILEVTAYPRVTSTSDTSTEIVPFVVKVCEPDVEKPEDKDEETIIVTPPTEEVVVPGTPISETVGTKSRSIFDRDNTMYTVLLTALVVLLLIAVILLLVKVFK